MVTMYEVSFWDGQHSTTKDFESKAAAIHYAQSQDEARLIKWNLIPNLPRCKPDLVYKSLAMLTWSSIESQWRQHAIFGGGGGSWPCDPTTEL